MINLTRYTYILIILALIFNSGCKDKWDEHNGAIDPNLKESLFTKIQKDPNLKVFTDLLVKSGYDSLLSTSVNFTVWAPSDAALANLDPAIINNPAALSSFVGNHIATSALLTTMATDTLEVKTLIGKNLLFTPTSIDDITLSRANDYASNGILHVTTEPVYRRDNIYEFLLKTNLVSKHREAITSRNVEIFDPSVAKVIGVDPKTGDPVYEPGSGLRTVNPYLQEFPINSENRLFTYIILSDEAFTNEMQSLDDYFTLASGNQDSTTLLTQANILKDLAFNGLYTPDKLPDSLKSTSRDSVKIHIEASDIVKTQRVSNGIVYVVKKIGYNKAAKVGVKVIQGEDYLTSGNPVNSTVVGRGSVVVTRVDSLGKTFSQLAYATPTQPRYWFKFRPTVLNSVKYKVYWRAVRDFNLIPSTLTGSISPFPQKITFGKFDATGAQDLGYKNVSIREVLQGTRKVYYPVYSEVYIGEYTNGNYKAEDIFIVSNTAAVNTQLTSIALDYIKLVPVVN